MATMTGDVASPKTHFPDLFGDEAPSLAQLRHLHYPMDAVKVVPQPPSGPGRFITAGPALETPDPATLELVLTAWTYGTEELSSYADPIRQATNTALLTMHSQDAAKEGLSEGDTVKLHLDCGTLEVLLRLSATMARGVVVLPKHVQLDWQQLQTSQEKLPICRIEKL
jgi:NADH-quinone oxidoreductase subunit G